MVVNLFILFTPVGFLMSRIVPMQVDEEDEAVTLSLDRTYLTCYGILERNHNPRVAEVVETASRLLEEYTDQFSNEAQ